MRRLLVALVSTLLVLFAPLSAFAQESPTATPPAPKSGPEVVNVGIYVNQITKLSLKENGFNVDFWIWFRWKDDALKPYETFEVTNGQITSKTGLDVHDVQGMHYANLRVVAEVTKFWNVSTYPLDDHELPIDIEDGDVEDDRLVYLADVESSGIDPDVSVPGFNISKDSTEVRRSFKHTNFGDISLPSTDESSYSQFRFQMRLRRAGPKYLLKIFAGLLVAALIGFLAFWMFPNELDPRFGLGVGGLFAAVASQYTVASNLPDTSVMSLSDKLHIVAFVFIFFSVVQSVWALKLFHKGQEAAWKRLDRIARYVFPIGYVVVSGLMVLLR